jgi:hypothetical protein
MGRSQAEERFKPVWSAAELVEIRRVMAAGLVLLAAELRGGGGPNDTVRWKERRAWGWM